MSASQAWQPDFTYGYGLIDAVEAVDYPAVTVLLNAERRKNENISVELLEKVGVFEASRANKQLSANQNSARFVNLFPGSYRVVVDDGQNIKLIDKSLIVPPSGTIYVE